ncbi:MAG: tRNA (adenosine(37)-N6)-threonylcarbamoyltransferase complex ATPase subunit type 1 TsaE [Ardenticatenaceae bacterium]|nr:tRNA (adenosine(37)-N6)-threonylcarbamoyltransferase complex ATPase subunit type 1 TsaE [Ardenticatenaceae bacterium]HBY99573.1 tRNA (adenosine(37)-N6)-threonylcarbamoyltransferase complex ATPase subunit type 1 TsaE [Chloroflexota bacterium]
MAVITGNTLDFFSHSPQQTRRIGQRLSRLLRPGDVVLLSGPLGSGKTHLAQGIGAGLGIETPIRSPTFTLINEYHEGCIPLYHVDLYRLHGDAEVATIGLEEPFEADDGVIVVEWPEHAPGWMPLEALFVTMRHVDVTKRGIAISASGERYERLLLDFKRSAFGGR